MKKKNCVSICNSEKFLDDSINFLKKERLQVILIGSGRRQIDNLSPIILRLTKLSDLNIRAVISRNPISGKKLALRHNSLYKKSLNLLDKDSKNKYIAIISVSNKSKIIVLLKILIFYRKRFKFLICESPLTNNFLYTSLVDFLSRLFNLPILVLSDQSFYPEVFAINNIFENFGINKINLILNFGSELNYHFLSRLSNLGIYIKNIRNFIYKDLSLNSKYFRENPKDYHFFANDFFLSRESLIYRDFKYKIEYQIVSEHKLIDPEAVIRKIILKGDRELKIWENSNHYLIKDLSKKEIGLTYSLLISLCNELFKMGYDCNAQTWDQFYSSLIGLKNKFFKNFTH